MEATRSDGGAHLFELRSPTKRVLRKAVTALSAAGLVLGMGLATAAPSQAQDLFWDEEVGGVTIYEAVHCVVNAKVCGHAIDAQKWAVSITDWKFPSGGPHHNNTADAFRHCSWAGAMTHRVGRDKAMEVLANHEAIDNKQPTAELEMDMANNLTGMEVGIKARSKGGTDQWGWILGQCEKLARTNQLEVLK